MKRNQKAIVQNADFFRSYCGLSPHSVQSDFSEKKRCRSFARERNGTGKPLKLEMAKKRNEFVLSDESINSYGCKVLTGGIQTADFERNPVMLANHDPNKAIGTWELSTSGNKLIGVPSFDDGDEEAKKFEGKVERGIIKGASIGIEILERTFETVAGGDVMIISKCNLIEASITPTPSNKNALKLYEGGKELSHSDILKLSTEFKNQNINPMKNLLIFLMSLPETVFAKLTASATEEHVIESIKLMVEENKSLKAQLATQVQKEKDALELQATTLVDDAVAANKILATQKEHFLKLAKSDYASTKAILDGMKTHQSASERINLGNGGGDEGKAVWEQEKYLNLSYAEMHKKHSAVLAQMKEKDWEKYSALYEAEYGKKPTK